MKKEMNLERDGLENLTRYQLSLIVKRLDLLLVLTSAIAGLRVFTDLSL